MAIASTRDLLGRLDALKKRAATPEQASSNTALRERLSSHRPEEDLRSIFAKDNELRKLLVRTLNGPQAPFELIDFAYDCLAAGLATRTEARELLITFAEQTLSARSQMRMVQMAHLFIQVGIGEEREVFCLLRLLSEFLEGSETLCTAARVAMLQLSERAVAHAKALVSHNQALPDSQSSLKSSEDVPAQAHTAAQVAESMHRAHFLDDLLAFISFINRKAAADTRHIAEWQRASGDVLLALLRPAELLGVAGFREAATRAAAEALAVLFVLCARDRATNPLCNDLLNRICAGISLLEAHGVLTDGFFAAVRPAVAAAHPQVVQLYRTAVLTALEARSDEDRRFLTVDVSTALDCDYARVSPEEQAALLDYVVDGAILCGNDVLFDHLVSFLSRFARKKVDARVARQVDRLLRWATQHGRRAFLDALLRGCYTPVNAATLVELRGCIRDSWQCLPPGRLGDVFPWLPSFAPEELYFLCNCVRAVDAERVVGATVTQLAQPAGEKCFLALLNRVTADSVSSGAGHSALCEMLGRMLCLYYAAVKTLLNEEARPSAAGGEGVGVAGGADSAVAPLLCPSLAPLVHYRTVVLQAISGSLTVAHVEPLLDVVAILHPYVDWPFVLSFLSESVVGTALRLHALVVLSRSYLDSMSVADMHVILVALQGPLAVPLSEGTANQERLFNTPCAQPAVPQAGDPQAVEIFGLISEQIALRLCAPEWSAGEEKARVGLESSLKGSEALAGSKSLFILLKHHVDVALGAVESYDALLVQAIGQAVDLSASMEACAARQDAVVPPPEFTAALTESPQAILGSVFTILRSTHATCSAEANACVLGQVVEKLSVLRSDQLRAVAAAELTRFVKAVGSGIDELLGYLNLAMRCKGAASFLIEQTVIKGMRAVALQFVDGCSGYFEPLNGHKPFLSPLEPDRLFESKESQISPCGAQASERSGEEASAATNPSSKPIASSDPSNCAAPASHTSVISKNKPRSRQPKQVKAKSSKNAAPSSQNTINKSSPLHYSHNATDIPVPAPVNPPTSKPGASSDTSKFSVASVIARLEEQTLNKSSPPACSSEFSMAKPFKVTENTPSSRPDNAPRESPLLKNAPHPCNQNNGADVSSLSESPSESTEITQSSEQKGVTASADLPGAFPEEHASCAAPNNSETSKTQPTSQPFFLNSENSAVQKQSTLKLPASLFLATFCTLLERLSTPGLLLLAESSDLFRRAFLAADALLPFSKTLSGLLRPAAAILSDLSRQEAWHAAVDILDRFCGAEHRQIFNQFLSTALSTASAARPMLIERMCDSLQPGDEASAQTVLSEISAALRSATANTTPEVLVELFCRITDAACLTRSTRALSIAKELLLESQPIWCACRRTGSCVRAVSECFGRLLAANNRKYTNTDLPLLLSACAHTCDYLSMQALHALIDGFAKADATQERIKALLAQPLARPRVTAALLGRLADPRHKELLKRHYHAVLELLNLKHSALAAAAHRCLSVHQNTL